MVQRKPRKRIEVSVHLRVHARRRIALENAGESGAEIIPCLVAWHHGICLRSILLYVTTKELIIDGEMMCVSVTATFQF